MKCKKCGEEYNIAWIFSGWFCLICGHLWSDDEWE